VAGDAADALAFVEHEPDSLGLEVVVELPAGRRRLRVSAIGLDIVSAFRKMSTKPDQAHLSIETAMQAFRFAPAIPIRLARPRRGAMRIRTNLQEVSFRLRPLSRPAG
jgi:hypothetical protein